ncbi:MAG TPA: delta-60 repeat domain-containing protein [Burkholderiales bacterium]|jgi:uncharacterized delta-60 repeat protein|nr:delta-60 repeat domain-containing protein [Burkholderiales bacterium]
MYTKQYLRKIIALAFASAAVLVGVANAADGDLDPSFGNNGRVTTDFLGGYDEARAVALEKNNKIVAAGAAFNSATGSYDFALARYKKDGSLDESFGDDGKVVTHVSEGNPRQRSRREAADAITIQHDGKIVVAGVAFNSATSFDNFAVLRYDNHGRLDSRFGNGGIVMTAFGAADAEAHDLQIQPDGKIVVVGTIGTLTAVGNAGPRDIALARYNPDGSLDISFGNGGKAVTDIFEIDEAYAVRLTQDGKILVGGATCFFRAPNCRGYGVMDTILLRYNPDGSLDPTFGDGGKATAFIGRCASITDIEIAPDGKIIVGGPLATLTCVPEDRSSFAVLRYNPDGSLDTSFDADGIVTTQFQGRVSITTAIALTTDGGALKIVAGGYHQQFLACGATEVGPYPCDFALIRYNWDGSLDPTFGAGGKASADFGGTEDSAFDLAIQRNGKIVQAGTNRGDFALARYLSDDCPLSPLNDGSLKTTSPLLDDAIDKPDDFLGCRFHPSLNL